MHLVKVKTRKYMKKFVAVPDILHSGNSCYVPPIHLDERGAYKKKNNPIFQNSEFELFLLLDESENPIGRIAAYIDFNHNEYYKTKIGFFGSFECIDDADAANMLISASENYLKEKGMETIRGPINPVAENWGFLMDGYDSTPVYLAPWNPSYYHDFFINTDYEKTKDLLAYEIDLDKGYTIPKRYLDFNDKFHKWFPDVKIRRLDLNNLTHDAKLIWELTNLSLADNWGYVPLELPVMEDMLKKLKLIVDRDAVWIVEEGDECIGYCLGFPDINIILKKIKGKLLPFGWTKLIFGTKKLRDYRLFGLAVHPKWQGRGLDAIMYINLYNHLKDKNVRMEANYILEDNLRIKNALLKLGMEYIKTYRIYDKRLGDNYA